MVAYSFKKQFIDPIVAGLEPGPLLPGMKRQTIRAPRRRHARPGETMQLYAAMRTKNCRRIGVARCVAASSITIWLPTRDQAPRIGIEAMPVDADLRIPSELDEFAHFDGFADFSAMADFWRANHPGVTEFTGVLIRWEPLNTEASR